MDEKYKYGIFPPYRTVQNGSKIGSMLIPGTSMEEWRVNLPKAYQELIESMSPEDRAEFERRVAESKHKRENR